MTREVSRRLVAAEFIMWCAAHLVSWLFPRVTFRSQPNVTEFSLSELAFMGDLSRYCEARRATRRSHPSWKTPELHKAVRDYFYGIEHRVGDGTFQHWSALVHEFEMRGLSPADLAAAILEWSHER